MLTSINKIGFSFLFLLFFCLSCYSQQLNIEITGIKNTKGQLLIGVYTSNENYNAKKPVIWKSFSKKSVKEGKLIANIKDLKPNTYGLALMDDEDSNWKMNFKLFVPSEGFAFSNYYHKGITQPTFDDFKFNFNTKDQTVVMKMRYI